MGRGKPPMELIASEKQRMLTFKKRKDGLFRKVHELTTLCGVKACVVIYGPNSSLKAETWPPQDRSDTVRQLFDVYRARKRDLGQVRNYGISDFFEERKKKAEDELQKLRKKNRESKYPSWFESLDSLDENELRQFGAILKNKIECAASRIGLFKETERELAHIIYSSNNNRSDNDRHQLQQQQGLSSPVNHQDPMMMMVATKNNNCEIPPHHHQISNIDKIPLHHLHHHQISNITKNNNEVPPNHRNQISYTNYGQQGGALVNGTASQQFDLVLSNHQNQQGCVQMQHCVIPQFEPQIPYMRQSMPMNVSVPVLPPQARYLHQNHQIMPMNVSAPVVSPQAPYLQQDQMISSNIELTAGPASSGWDLESGNGGLEDIVAYMRRRM